MLEKGKTYKFKVVEVFQNVKGKYMYRVVLADSVDSIFYSVYLLKCQSETDFIEYIYCDVVDYYDSGIPILYQNEYYLFKTLYKPNVSYSFDIISQINNSPNGNKQYVIKSELGLSHIYISYNDENLNIGDKIKLSVMVKEGHNLKALIYFTDKSSDFESFKPEHIFEVCNHSRDYHKFFEQISDYANYSIKISESLESMNDKLKLESRLWIFDYLSALSFIAIRLNQEHLEEIEILNNLIHDIEIWLLEESGILTKFSPQKREETKTKSEQVIKRTEAVTDAISIINKKEQSKYLNDVLSKLRKSMYLRDREHVLGIIYNLVILDTDFVRNNIVLISEFIDYSSHEITDTFILERIVSILSNQINVEKKEVNKKLHYLRTFDTDKEIFTNLIIGIGTLLNFHSIKQLDEQNEYQIKVDQLFPALCKYLSYGTSYNRALSLINKSLEAVLSRTKYFRLDGVALRNVSSNPEKLVDFILRMPFQPVNIDLKSVRGNIYQEYKNGKINIAYLPNDAIIKKSLAKTNQLYSIPGTSLNVTSFFDEDQWEISDSLSYYIDKWRILLSENNVSLSENGEDNQMVIIRTKPINPNYNKMVFCSRIDCFGTDDGVIGVKNYTKDFLLECNITEIFDENLYFKANINRTEKGRVNFDIINNIIQYSNWVAANSSDMLAAMCLSNRNREAIFITENGITCRSRSDSFQQIKKGFVYNITVDVKDENEYPIAIVSSTSNRQFNQIELLKNQLKLISEYNQDQIQKNKSDIDTNFPYIHLIIDNYLRLYDDKILRYNLYHIARLFALSEKSTLSNYYLSCIQYMEMTESFIQNRPVQYSLPNFNWSDDLQSSFPSLKNHTDKYNLLKNFGSENDIEYLYRLAINENVNEETSRFAKLSLAASLIESVSDDEKPIKYLRGMVAKEFVLGEKTLLVDLPENEGAVSFDDCGNLDFGIENQTTEFKTSIVYPAGGNSEKMDLEYQMFVILKVIAGFLNATGGTLYIGIKDDGSINGIEADLKALSCNIDKYERILRDKIVHEFNKDVNSLINFNFPKCNNRTICTITIPQYGTPIALRGDFYQRQGNEIRIIKGNDLVMFIRRRIEGKDTIIENTDIEIDRNKEIQNNEINVNPIMIESSMLDSIEPKEENSECFALSFYKNGTYQLGHDLPMKDSVALLNIKPSMKNLYILQCYDNGCINKMPVRNLYNMRFGFLYKNGLSKEALLKHIMILSDSDFVLVKSRQSGISYVKVYSVNDISSHATLGLRGNQLLIQNFEVLDYWVGISGKDVQNISRLITKTRNNLGAKIDSASYSQERRWLSSYMNKINSK